MISGTVLPIQRQGISNPSLKIQRARIEDALPGRRSRRIDHLPGKDRVRVSESGIRSNEDLLYLKGLGIDAVLVGEHLMREADPSAALKRLRGV